MTEQKCVRTYDKNEFGYNTTRLCCVELTEHLEKGWKVLFITPKTGYTEYIIERKVDNSIMEAEK